MTNIDSFRAMLIDGYFEESVFFLKRAIEDAKKSNGIDDAEREELKGAFKELFRRTDEGDLATKHRVMGLFDKAFSDHRISYRSMPSACKRDDEDCMRDMSVGALFMALDYVTTGRINYDLSAAQLLMLVDNEGRFSDELISATAEEFNRSNRDISLSGVPYAIVLEDYLQTEQPKIHELFIDEPSRTDSDDLVTVIKESLLDLANKLEDAANGKKVPIDMRESLVRVYDNGFAIPDMYHFRLIKKLGGQRNADEARRMLIEAFNKLPPNNDDGVPCDKDMGNGVVDVSECYRKTSRSIRALAGQIE